jgi:hypothetical protein
VSSVRDDVLSDPDSSDMISSQPLMTIKLLLSEILFSELPDILPSLFSVLFLWFASQLFMSVSMLIITFSLFGCRNVVSCNVFSPLRIKFSSFFRRFSELRKFFGCFKSLRCVEILTKRQGNICLNSFLKLLCCKEREEIEYGSLKFVRKQ